MLRKLVFVLAVLLAAPAFAQADKPKAINSYIHADTPYGEGTLSKLLFYIYDASVWTDEKEWSMDSTYALCLKYRMNFDAADLVDRSLQEMDQQEPLTDTDKEMFKNLLTKVFPNVKKGDNITALYRPSRGVTLYHNDKPTGSIADQTLAKRFLSIWLSPKTSEPELRKKLVEKPGA